MQSFLGSIHDRCPPGQIWREFTQNAIEAYTRHKLTGDVVWHHEEAAEQSGRYHWAVYDAGVGMSRETMRAYLGKVFSSGGTIAADRNHGIGSRQAGLRDSPGGIQWLSLYDGVVSSAHLSMKDGKLPEIEWDDSYTADDLPDAIVKAGHGTQVIFWGMPAQTRRELYNDRLWTKLAQRYHQLPDGLAIKVQAWVDDNGEQRSTFHSVTPHGVALADCAEISEPYVFSDGSYMEIFVLRPEHLQNYQGDKFRKEHDLASKHKLTDLKARVCVVYQNEAYENVAGGGAQQRIQRFGLTYGSERVVLMLYPNPKKFVPSEERSRIVPRAVTGREGPGLPVDEWAAEFVANMPESIRAYVEQSAVGTRADGLRELYDRARHVWSTNCASSSSGEGEHGGEGLSAPEPRKRKKKKQELEREDDSDDERGPSSPRQPATRGAGHQQGGHRDAFSLPRIDWVRNKDLPDEDPCRHKAGFYNHNALGGALLKLNEDWVGLAEWRKAVGAGHPGWSGPRVKVATREVYQVLAIDLILRARYFSKEPPSSEEIGECFQQRMARELVLDALHPRGLRLVS
ncbi:MAG: hypothetical protein M9894_32995 [Planctomycetes bacterium]|nr:hypothetical protein [Planctomycetota bacterium]